MNITSKLPDVGTTIFTVMSQLANDHNAINLRSAKDTANLFPADPGHSDGLG